MYFDDCNNPMALYKAIDKILRHGNFESGPTRTMSSFGDGNIKLVSYTDKKTPHEKFYREARYKALDLWSKNPDRLPKVREVESDPVFGLQSVAEWCIEAERIMRGRDKKRRGSGEREQHVEEAYDALHHDTKGEDLAKWINNKYGREYRKMTAGNVTKTDAWKKRHPTKK